MTTRLEDLEARVAALEQGFARLCHQLRALPGGQAPAAPAAVLPSDPQARQAALDAALEAFFAAQGITGGEQVGLARLRALQTEHLRKEN